MLGLVTEKVENISDLENEKKQPKVPSQSVKLRDVGGDMKSYQYNEAIKAFIANGV